MRWYTRARIVRLIRRSKVRHHLAAFSEQPELTGTVGRLSNDIIDEGLEGISGRLHKHFDYARL